MYYKDRTIYDCDCFEFWLEVTNQAIPNIVPKRYYVSNFGRIWDMKHNREVKYSMHYKGYKQATFYTLEGKSIIKKVHRVVMLMFAYFPGCEKFTVNHMDTVKLNNMILNLEWCTESENTVHAINNGVKMVFGKPVKTFSEDQINELLDLAKKFGNNAEAARVFNAKYGSNINKNYVNNIIHGKCRHGRITKTEYYGLQEESSSTSNSTYSQITNAFYHA